MDSKTFDRFRKIVYEQSGISLGPNKEALVSARLGKRMRALHIGEYDEYLRYVTEDESGAEVVSLVDAISTNVTSFFREASHFDFLSDVFSGWLGEGQRRFRFWSAASSSGEEPFSMAITLLEALKGQDADVRILATDISTKMLDRCRQGTYRGDKLDGVPPVLRERYFHRNGNGECTAKQRMKNMLLFRRLDLSTPPFPMRGPLDIIFCRNVMIYFDNTTRRRLLEEMFRLLKRGGYLIVGHAESLTAMMSEFKSVRPSIYVK